MKKRIDVLLICILILFSCGCQKEDKYAKYTRIAVLSNEESNESKILFMDDDHEVIFQLETEFVDEAIHIDDKLYLGKDKNNYQAIDCVDVEFWIMLMLKKVHFYIIQKMAVMLFIKMVSVLYLIKATIKE